MTRATIPATPHYPEMILDDPATEQVTVDAGIRAANEWLSRPWDDGQSHFTHFAEAVAEVAESHRDAFAAGYLGRIHQNIKAPQADPGQQLIHAPDNLIQTILCLLKDVAEKSSDGKLKAKGHAARDLMRRVEGLAAAMHDATEEVNAMARGHHDE